MDRLDSKCPLLGQLQHKAVDHLLTGYIQIKPPLYLQTTRLCSLPDGMMSLIEDQLGISTTLIMIRG
jgi:hypothetical protein